MLVLSCFDGSLLSDPLVEACQEERLKSSKKVSALFYEFFQRITYFELTCVVGFEGGKVVNSAVGDP